MGEVRGDKRGSEPVDRELAVYAEERAVNEMEEGYIRLYLAIFKEAAKRDMAKVKGMIYTELKNIGVSKSEIRRFIDENSSRIEQDVQAAVHEEAQDWPYITNAQTVRTQYQIRNKYVRIFESERVA